MTALLGWLPNFLLARCYRTRIDINTLDIRIVFCRQTNAPQRTTTHSKVQHRQRSAAQRSSAEHCARHRSTAEQRSATKHSGAQMKRIYFCGCEEQCGRNAARATIASSSNGKNKKLFTLLDLCVSSLRRGHANLLCIVPILTDDPRRESKKYYCRNVQINNFSNPCGTVSGLRPPLSIVMLILLVAFAHSSHFGSRCTSGGCIAVTQAFKPSIWAVVRLNTAQHTIHRIRGG